MDWNVVTGIATAVTAFGAIGSTWAAILFAVKKQNENFERSNQGFRLSLSADLALKLDGTFNSNAFRRGEPSQLNRYCTRRKWPSQRRCWIFLRQ